MDFQKVAKNTGVLIIGRITTVLFSIIITVYLIRYFGSTGFGKYNIVYAYLSFFILFSIFGINRIIVREISRDNTKADILLGNSLVLCAFLSIISILFSWIFLNFLSYPNEIKNFVYIASASIFFISIGTIYTSIFQVYLEQKYQVIVEVTSKLILGVGVVLLVLLKANLIYFFLLDIFIAIVILTGNRFFSKYFIKPKFNIDTNILVRFLKESWPISVSSILTIITMRIDHLILYQIKGAENVGLYSAIIKIVEALDTIPIALGSSIFPLLSRDYIDSDSFNKTYETSLKYISFIIIPVCLFITFFSKSIILLLYGGNFVLAQTALSVLIWSSLWHFTGIIFTQALVATGNQKFIPISAGFDTFFNIILNLILIPKYGITGAGISKTISYISGRLICYIFFKEIRQYILSSLKCLIKPLIYFLIPAAIIYMIY